MGSRKRRGSRTLIAGILGGIAAVITATAALLGLFVPAPGSDVKHPLPIANAGSSFEVNEGDLVTLDGTRSFAPGGDIVVYEWIQTGRNPVDIDMAIELDPSFVDSIWSSIGSALRELGKYDESLESHTKAIKLEPENAYYWNDVGLTYEAMERYNDALESYEKAIELDQDSAIYWRNRGLALAALERYDEAIKSYDKAIELDPEYALGWYSKGNALDKLGKYDEARESYDKAVELDPSLKPHDL